MPSYTMLNVRIQRDSNTVPWGFRMQGGKDFGSPLQIQYVNPNSLAEQSGMQINDYIVRIGQTSTEYLDHKEAQEHIKRQSNVLEFILQRGAPPSSADYNSQINFPSHQPHPANIAPPSSGAQIGGPGSNNRVMLGHTYNTPIGLYSADNITDTIARTLKSINVSNYQLEEAKTANEYKPTAVKSMPKPAPAPYTPSPQAHPAPHAPSSKPNATAKPTFNANKGAPNSGNRGVQRGSKGSALLNRNDNANQMARCYACGVNIRGPFISAIGRCYCVDHFTCSNCSINLQDCGFVEENGKLYCENDFEQYLAPFCGKCSQKILKECVHAMEKTWHPQCFLCTACKKSLGSNSFHIEEGQPYCAEDYRRMFQAKCTGCEFPIEPGDKYLEAMGGIYHAECFNCSSCQISLDGQAFVVKNNRPYCRQHARQMGSLFN